MKTFPIWALLVLFALAQDGKAQGSSPGLPAPYDRVKSIWTHDEHGELVLCATLPQSTSMDVIRQCAEAGLAAAQRDLAWAYSKGQFVEKNHKEAFRWFQKAAEQGDPAAENGLGLSYSGGHGVERNLTTAVAWYRKSAEHGYFGGQVNLGNALMRGMGCAADPQEGFRWYLAAAKQGWPKAQAVVASCYFQGNGVSRNYFKGYLWLRKALAAGPPEVRGPFKWVERIAIVVLLVIGVVGYWLFRKLWSKLTKSSSTIRPMATVGLVMLATVWMAGWSRGKGDVASHKTSPFPEQAPILCASAPRLPLTSGKFLQPN